MDKWLEDIDKRYPDSTIPFDRLGERLGEGEEGRVYRYGSLALKIVTKRHTIHVKKSIKRQLEWFRDNPHPNVVRIHYVRELDRVAYWYVMEKLVRLNRAEQNHFERVQTTLWSRPRRRQRLLNSYVPRSTIGVERKQFMESMSTFPYSHEDLIAANVMKNNLGKWIATDIESFRLPRSLLKATS